MKVLDVMTPNPLTVSGSESVSVADELMSENSIRQIPGAFEQVKHRVAGRSLTLDEIEKTVLPEFKEPRLYLALGRGAVGSGRLRSEAYAADRLKQQLDDLQQEFVNEETMIKIDRAANVVSVTPILSWRSAEFVAAYDPGATGSMAQRSPSQMYHLPHTST